MIHARLSDRFRYNAKSYAARDSHLYAIQSLMMFFWKFFHLVYWVAHDSEHNRWN